MTDLSRRDVLKTGGVTGVAAAAGCYTQNGSKAVLGPIGGETAERISEHFVIASTLEAGLDAVKLEPARIQLEGGAVFWEGTGRFIMSESGIEVDVGHASNYKEAKQRVDRFPTLVVTTQGNEYLFQEGDL